jgi:hypothetical protein
VARETRKKAQCGSQKYLPIPALDPRQTNDLYKQYCDKKIKQYCNIVQFFYCVNLKSQFRDISAGFKNNSNILTKNYRFITISLYHNIFLS